jgi:hypothetical protein
VGNSVALTTNLVPQSMLPDKTVTPNKPGAYFLMGEVSYPYTPQFGLGFISKITMNDRIFMLPRLSDQVPLSDEAAPHATVPFAARNARAAR